MPESRCLTSASLPMNPLGLSQAIVNSSPDVDQRVAVVDVDRVVAIRLLQAEGVEGEQPRVPDPQVRARREQRVVDADRLIARDMELPAELAEVRHADRVREPHPHLDLPGAHVGERLVRQVGGRESRQQLARPRALHGQERPRARHVGDGHELALGAVALEPPEHPPVDHVGPDHEERVLGRARDREVRPDPARSACTNACR